MKTGTLTEDNIEFNYDIVSVDIASATMIVSYTPTDTTYSPLTLNVNFIEDRTDTYLDSDGQGQPVVIDVPKTFEEHVNYSVRMAAPATCWRSQKLLLDNISSIT